MNEGEQDLPFAQGNANDDDYITIDIIDSSSSLDPMQKLSERMSTSFHSSFVRAYPVALASSLIEYDNSYRIIDSARFSMPEKPGLYKIAADFENEARLRGYIKTSKALRAGGVAWSAMSATALVENVASTGPDLINPLAGFIILLSGLAFIAMSFAPNEH